MLLSASTFTSNSKRRTVSPRRPPTLPRQSSHHLRIPLIDSPLPSPGSPGLPSIVPRHGKKPAPRWAKRLRRFICYLTLLSVLVTVFFSSRFQSPAGYRRLLAGSKAPFEAPNAGAGAGAANAIVNALSFHKPTPVVLPNNWGCKRWSMFIPPYSEYPLPPREYSDLCAKSRDVVGSIKNACSLFTSLVANRWSRKDHNYIDIDEAFASGLLPSLPDGSQAHMNDVNSFATVVGGDKYAHDPGSYKVCEKSLVFLLQTEDAGLGPTLLNLWLSYGIAKKEGRAFFIDDTNWPYGEYSSYFKSPPMPDCRPPPTALRNPYPRQTRHLLVTSETAPFVFTQYYPTDSASLTTSAQAQKPAFELMRSGYEALFKLQTQIAQHYSKRLTDVHKSVHDQGGMVIGLHVRHGDLHPLESEYRESYFPLELYRDVASQILFDHGKVKENQGSPDPSVILAASDNPEVYDSPSMSDTQRAQTLISLASRQKANTDSRLGWEGGFFKNLFWSLGSPPQPPVQDSPNPSRRQHSRAHALKTPKEDYYHYHPTTRSLQLRRLVGHAYVLDLAVLGESDAVICAYSSAFCRLLAVIMGWEKAIAQEQWTNIDGFTHWLPFIPEN